MAEEYEQHFVFKLADGYSEEEIAAKLGDPTALAAQFDAAAQGGEKRSAVLTWLWLWLAVLESHGAPVYLETHKAVNTRIYAHLGFHTVDTCAIPGTGITQYAMLRPARRPLR